MTRPVSCHREENDVIEGEVVEVQIDRPASGAVCLLGPISGQLGCVSPALHDNTHSILWPPLFECLKPVQSDFWSDYAAVLDVLLSPFTSA
jgi:hypothetical protein